jgi:putative transposase
MNDSQKAAYQQKVVKEESKPQENQKKIKCNLFEAPTKENPYVDYNFLDSLFKVITQNDYRSLYAQSSQGIMKTVFQNWKSFFASLKEYKENPSKYKARPRIPRYSRASEKEVLFTNQDCVIKENKI